MSVFDKAEDFIFGPIVKPLPAHGSEFQSLPTQTAHFLNIYKFYDEASSPVSTAVLSGTNVTHSSLTHSWCIFNCVLTT